MFCLHIQLMSLEKKPLNTQNLILTSFSGCLSFGFEGFWFGFVRVWSGIFGGFFLLLFGLVFF